ncbi:MAG: peptidoglycan editing factor PgeF [Betaproteobacteria bacterium]|nr:peptidoglycan editing factor PgeF [Betaproteobacteria bacterium]MCL2886113.1 peptidoglycan editing factor PgeF [Betaproteobacteria bacterium]
MPEVLQPQWPAPPRVRALQTLRGGGCSPAPWASFNLGDHVGDDPERVAANRADLRRLLPAEPLWLRQVHGVHVVDAGRADGEMDGKTAADAAFTRQPASVCAIMTADCLPVLLCDRAGSVVAAAHAGWRGLAAGVLEATITAMNAPPAELLAWLGPAIGPRHFEVGPEVLAAFAARDPAAGEAFRALGNGKWLADIYALARQRLAASGVSATFGGERCTVGEAGHFFSYRRDGATGRMATLIWLAADSS